MIALLHQIREDPCHLLKSSGESNDEVINQSR